MYFRDLQNMLNKSELYFCRNSSNFGNFVSNPIIAKEFANIPLSSYFVTVAFFA